MTHSSLISLNHATVTYPTFQLGPVVCSFEPGLHAILGPNGAGKSTLLRLVTGLQIPDSGKVTALGIQMKGRNKEVLSRLGIVTDSRESLPQELSAIEYWRLIARVRAQRNRATRDILLDRASQLASDLGFEKTNVPIADLSLGNAKKATIVGALMHSPSIVVMDEPESGLDPLSQIDFEQVMRRIAREGACVLVATHDIRWAESEADYAHIILDGSLVASDSVAVLVEKYRSLPDAYRTLAEAIK